MIALKINTRQHRQDVIIALAENGYTVRVVEKHPEDNEFITDMFVEIVEEPELPKYKE